MSSDDAKKALHEALTGIQPPSAPHVNKAIELLEALPADNLALVAALLERVRQVGYEDGYEDGCRDERNRLLTKTT